MSPNSISRYHSINAYFTFACFALPVAGAVSSFNVNGGALVGLVAVCTGFIAISRDREMVLLGAAIYAYSLFYLASFAANPVTSQSLRYLPEILTFLMFPFLYSGWSISNKATIARCVVMASMVACYAALCVAAVQFHMFGMRAQGGAGNPIVFANVTCVAASLSLAGVFSQERKWAWPLVGAFAAGACAMLYSGSRIGWVALVAATTCVLYINRKTIRTRISPRIVAAAAIAIASVVIVGFETISIRAAALLEDWGQLSQHGNYNTSLGHRAGLWEVGFDLAREAPLLGHGPQSTRGLITEGLRDYGIKKRFTHFHNGFLTAMVETGIFGALSLAAIFLIAAQNARRTLKANRNPAETLGAVLLVVVVVTYLVMGTTGILVGHDILDSMLVACLAAGTFLSAGTPGAGQARPAAQQAEHDRQRALIG